MRDTRLIHGSTALGAIAFLAALLLAPAAEADPQAARSRSSASSSSGSSSSGGGSSASRASAPSSTPRSSAPRTGVSRSPRGAAVTRSGHRGPATGPRRPVAGTSTHLRPGHGRTYGGYTSPYYGRYYGYPYYGYYPYWGYPSYGWSVGLGWWGGYYSPYLRYYSPHSYGPYGGPYERAPRAAYVEAEPVGAFDLNVKPKKTEVWVDGYYVGTAGRFDGFPDYLWLSEGKHQLVFYLEGHATVERQVETLAGVVGDLRIQMEPGRSIPPRQLAVKPPPPPPAAPRAPAAATGERRAEASGDPAASRDLRAEPGRLVLSVVPEDASVYLDGRYLGTGRDLARLHAGLLIDSGDHLLEVVRPGYRGREIEFSVGAGEEERIEIGLESG